MIAARDPPHGAGCPVVSAQPPGAPVDEPGASPIPEPPPRRGSGVARNTAIFSIATGLSRVVGLVREIVAARYFATSGPASAFTIAFQVPNLIRGLFADA